MGCFGRVFRWRRRNTNQGEQEFGPRPAHDSLTSGTSAFSDIEKAYIKDRDPAAGPVSTLPPSAANIRPAAHPQFSAYSGVAVRDDRSHIYTPRYRGGGSSYRPDDSRDWTGSQVSTQVSRQSDTYLTKLKDEGGVDDPEELARRKKRDEIQRKAAEEEQERLDFFQMM